MNKSDYLGKISGYSSEAYSYLHRIRFLANKETFTDIDLQDIGDYLMVIHEDIDGIEYCTNRVKAMYDEVDS